MLTDYEIAKQAGIRPITDIATKLGVDKEDLLPYGDEVAKVSLNALTRPRKRPNEPRLILVSATTPTAAGEGKTTTYPLVWHRLWIAWVNQFAWHYVNHRWVPVWVSRVERPVVVTVR